MLKVNFSPVLATNYLAYSNSLRLDIQVFYAMSDVKTREDQSYLDIVSKTNDKS
ncbi:MAG: hypothetical protein JRF49_09190 [Deltaproteobacteria bacterium]|nr:hypothetical protein [Deltaproteobacteria bacterium]